MFKKAIIATAVLAASTGLAFANGGTMQQPHCTHSAYVGVAVSRDAFTIDGTEGVDLGTVGWGGELNAGIGWVFQDHYYLGGEIFGTANNASIDVLGLAKLKYRYSYGIDLVPGVKISDSTMLYGKVGYVRGNFKGTATTTGSSSTTNFNGLQLGVGMETMVTNNVSAKIEYDYNRYSKKGGSRPQIDTVKLGVAYHFMSA